MRVSELSVTVGIVLGGFLAALLFTCYASLGLHAQSIDQINLKRVQTIQVPDVPPPYVKVPDYQVNPEAWPMKTRIAVLAVLMGLVIMVFVIAALTTEMLIGSGTD